MEKLLDYHDASINKIEYSLDKNELVIGIETYDDLPYDLYFTGVIGWSFSSFEVQNHLLDFRIYDSISLPSYLIEDYEVEQVYLELMNTKKGYFFELDPATGMGGYIIAINFKVEKRDKLK
ncbi:hypothetical protein [Adhaeribacter pallidiroseus]|uniref:Uncharacterized protein n=1 Tax=Adhaeribacter pallidiroseus TaxID=2072847 RepID=A0A369QJN9_9BACT|nr:hypothetical protein [Adhaeribacter pallidiroseus]RDC62488.1 hypothetical protein AHMF7616_01082 [Adhaeribacter pallidiroseus]